MVLACAIARHGYGRRRRAGLALLGRSVARPRSRSRTQPRHTVDTVRGRERRIQNGREFYTKILVGLCAVFDIDPQQWNRLSLTRLPNTVESRTRHLSTTKIVGAQHSKEDKDVEPGTGPTRLELADGER